MACYVVGDIQGCYSGLVKLLDKLSFSPTTDTLYAVGDLVARGDDSLSTLRLLKGLGPSFKAVLGNHDLHFLAVSQGLRKAKKSDRLNTLLEANDLVSIVNWLRQFPLAMPLSENQVMVHAGLYPGWSIPDLLGYSQEISDILRGPLWVELLASMYGNGPEKWHDKLKGEPRHRFIINATTRMRYVKSDLALDMQCKSAPADAPQKLHPWFSLPNLKIQAEQSIIFGHWASLLGKTSSKQFIALDTGYVWGNTLTALRLEDNKRISVDADK